MNYLLSSASPFCKWRAGDTQREIYYFFVFLGWVFVRGIKFLAFIGTHSTFLSSAISWYFCITHPCFEIASSWACLVNFLKCLVCAQMLTMCTDSCTSYLLWISKGTFYKVEISGEDGKAAVWLFNVRNRYHKLRKKRTCLLGIAEYLEEHRVTLRKKNVTHYRWVEVPIQTLWGWGGVTAKHPPNLNIFLVW